MKRIAAFSLLLVASCDDRPQEWIAWVYPHGENLVLSESMIGFETFEKCQQAAIMKLQSYKEPDAGAYQCGYMCRYDPQSGVNVCKEIRK